MYSLFLKTNSLCLGFSTQCLRLPRIFQVFQVYDKCVLPMIMFSDHQILVQSSEPQVIKNCESGSEIIRSQETQCGFEEFSLDDTAFAITLWDCEKSCSSERIDWTESTELYVVSLRALPESVSKKWPEKANMY